MTDVHSLLLRTVAGDSQAWRALQAALEPEIVSISRGHRALRSKGLASLPDDLAEVRTATLERLAHDDFHNLKRFLEHAARPGEAQASFDAWLYGAVDFVIREHLRQRFGRAPKPAADAARPQPSKRDLQSHAGRLSDEIERGLLRTLGMTARLTLNEIFAHLERDFSPEEICAVRLYYVEDQDFDEIARRVGLDDAKQAEKLIRKLNARLRYRFGDAQEG